MARGARGLAGDVCCEGGFSPAVLLLAPGGGRDLGASEAGASGGVAYVPASHDTGSMAPVSSAKSPTEPPCSVETRPLLSARRETHVYRFTCSRAIRASNCLYCVWQLNVFIPFVIQKA